MGDSTVTPHSELPILATKLFAPRLRERVVGRERLTSLLDQASGFVLVSAPAGFGKSTILADWLERQEAPYAWLSLEPADGEPRRFLRYLAGALGQLEPGLQEALLPCLKAPQLPAVEAVLLPLLNALAGLDQPAVLVLDDFHAIEDPTVHAWMEHWIDHLPPGFRLVVSTRVDPPYSLSRWRGQGRLTELRALDLRFSDDECGGFLHEVMGLDLPRPLVSALQQRTEGWIVGLQMAALSLRGQDDVNAFVEAFTGSHRFVLDYLTDEVLARQPEEILDFLLRVSPLERFNAALCDAVLERADSRRQLGHLEAENLFLIPLDGEREWFRFHHLFRQLLERQLELRVGEDAVRQLRIKACDWLAEGGFADEALAQAQAAGDRERTLSVLERFAERTLQEGDAASVMQWFEATPVDWIEARPRLALTRALSLFLAVRWSELEAWAPRLQELLVSELDPETEGRVLTLAACAAIIHADRPATIHSARRALELLPPEDRILRAVAAITLGSVLVLEAEYEDARAAFQEAGRLSRQGEDPLDLDATCSYYENRMDVTRGQLREPYDRHRRAWKEATRGRVPPPMASLYLIGQADVCYEWGDLDQAAALCEEAIGVNRGCFPFNELRARLLLMDVARSRRDFSAALRQGEGVLEIMKLAVLQQWESQVPLHRLRTRALEAEVTGDRAAEDEWAAWAAQQGLQDDDRLEDRLLPEDPQAAAVILGIRWLLHQGQHAKALDWSQRLTQLAEAKEWMRVVLEARLLKARGHDGLGQGDQTRQALAEAFALAEPSRFLQVLADEREWLQSLPPDVLDPALEAVGTAFRAQILATFDASPSPGTTAPATADLPEPLSERELEVLEAVAAGGTNASVGRALFISPRTVKKHLENIYGKLGVHNRGEAVHRARSLGLLRREAEPARPT